MTRWEYKWLVLRITGAKAGVFSLFQSKRIHTADAQGLQELGRLGWEITAIVPITHGALGTDSTDAAIALLKRPILDQGEFLESRPDAGRRLPLADDTKKQPRVSHAELERAIAREKLVLSMRSGSYPTEGEFSNLVGENEADVAEELVTLIKRTLRESSQVEIQASPAAVQFLENCKTYFAQLPGASAQRYLYGLLSDPPSFTYALDLIRELHLLDLRAVEAMLRSEDFPRKRVGLNILQAMKSTYTSEDLAAMEQLIGLLKHAFPTAESAEKEGALFSKRFWTCPACHAQTPEAYKDCRQCGARRDGLKRTEFTDDQAIELLSQQLKVLRALLASRVSEEPRDLTS